MTLSLTVSACGIRGRGRGAEKDKEGDIGESVPSIGSYHDRSVYSPKRQRNPHAKSHQPLPLTKKSLRPNHLVNPNQPQRPRNNLLPIQAMPTSPPQRSSRLFSRARQRTSGSRPNQRPKRPPRPQVHRAMTMMEQCQLLRLVMGKRRRNASLA